MQVAAAPLVHYGMFLGVPADYLALGALPKLEAKSLQQALGCLTHSFTAVAGYLPSLPHSLRGLGVVACWSSPAAAALCYVRLPHCSLFSSGPAPPAPVWNSVSE